MDLCHRCFICFADEREKLLVRKLVLGIVVSLAWRRWWQALFAAATRAVAVVASDEQALFNFLGAPSEA